MGSYKYKYDRYRDGRKWGKEERGAKKGVLRPLTLKVM